MCDLYRFHSKTNSRGECDEWINSLWPYRALYELTDTHWVTNIILTIYCPDRSPAGNHSSQRCRTWQASCEHVPRGTADSRGRCVNPFCSRWSVCVKLQRERDHWNDSCYLTKEWGWSDSLTTCPQRRCSRWGLNFSLQLVVNVGLVDFIKTDIPNIFSFSISLCM